MRKELFFSLLEKEKTESGAKTMDVKLKNKLYQASKYISQRRSQ